MTRSASHPLTGGEALVRELAVHGVTDVFCVPGESYLPVLDALHDADIRLTTCRQEGGAAMMAEAAGKLTGRPGICMVTRGPGATNASAGVHVAMQDSTPMILFVGQIERGMKEREAFQEVDYKAVFGTMAKWVAEIDSADRIPEFVSRAFHVAVAGRPGPVVLALPEDVLSALTEAPPSRPARGASVAPAPDGLAELLDRLARAANPVVIAGGSGWDAQAVADLVTVSERLSLPVACSFRRQDRFPADHPHYIGDLGIGPNPRLLARLRDADLILLLGGRLSEMPSQSYELLRVPVPQQTLVHVHPGADELGRVYAPDLSFNLTPAAFLRALAKAGATGPDRSADIATARQAFLDWSDRPTAVPGGFNLGQVFVQLRDELPADAVITNGAGNYASWLHRYHRFTRFGTQLAPTSGSMGYGLPAAIAAKRMDPARTVIAFAGDGCFLMTGQEFATAVHHGINVIAVVVDNGMYGTIRMHQERRFPNRVVATALTNPDFAAYARAFGGHGETVTATKDFLPALRRAMASGKPAILHCLTDPEALTPARSLTQIRDGG